jgi:dephospho-CoA kinase
LYKLFRVGLTGNIASGKSTVVNVWRSLGAAVVDADVLAREAIAPGSRGYERVLREFGTVDRAELRDIVFGDAARRKQLESIIHPEVARLRAEREQEFANQGKHIVVNDIPLLFEANLFNEFDFVVLVDAPRDIRISRMVANRGLERDEAVRMVDAQMPSEEKRGRADIVIDNDGTLAQLQQRAAEAWQAIQDLVE